MANAEAQVKRNQEIMRLWRRGVSLSQIGMRVGLTKERVRQVVLSRTQKTEEDNAQKTEA